MIQIPKNIEFEKCINHIPNGRQLLKSFQIKYQPNLNSITENTITYFLPNIKPQNYIAAFDLDWTLTAQENKLHSYSASPHDITILPQRLEVLNTLFKSGYTLVVFTNQYATKKNIQSKIDRITTFLLKLKLPCYVFISTGKDEYRKPKIGMWNKLNQILPNIKYALYVGDAAGRKQDFSDSDIQFAKNAQIDFFTPEEFFPCDKIQINHINKTMIVLVGVMGSGKSHISQQFSNLGYKVVSRDNLGGNKTKYLNYVKKTANNFRNVVADSTNGKLEDRKILYEIAQTNSMNIITIYILRDGYGWNKLRQKPVPDIAYHTYYKHFDKPTLSNTPAELIIVNNICDIN